jgi:hypothetical protein
LQASAYPSPPTPPTPHSSSTSFSIDPKKLEAVVQEIKQAGGDAIGVAGDVGASDFPKKIVDATVQ